MRVLREASPRVGHLGHQMQCSGTVLDVTTVIATEEGVCCFLYGVFGVEKMSMSLDGVLYTRAAVLWTSVVWKTAGVSKYVGPCRWVVS